jgi:hypothetical protein
MKRTIIGTLLAAATLTANAGALDQIEAMSIQSPSEAESLANSKVDAKHVTVLYHHLYQDSREGDVYVTNVMFTNIPCAMAEKPRDRGWKVYYRDSKSNQTLVGCGDSMGLEQTSNYVGYKVGHGLEGSVNTTNNDYRPTSLAWAIGDAMSRLKFTPEEELAFAAHRYGREQ